MAEKSYKCPYCHKPVLANEAVPVKKRYWHPQCLQQEKEQKKVKAEIKQEVKLAARNDPDYKNLVKYICKLYDLEQLTPMIRSQIEKYHEQYDMKYKGMKLSLEYFYEIKENEIKSKYGIGIVPSIYGDAKALYLSQMKMKRSLKQYNGQQQTNTVKVNMKPKNNRQDKLIDISKI
jgi:hypothetical protein